MNWCLNPWKSCGGSMSASIFPLRRAPPNGCGSSLQRVRVTRRLLPVRHWHISDSTLRPKENGSPAIVRDSGFLASRASCCRAFRAYRSAESSPCPLPLRLCSAANSVKLKEMRQLLWAELAKCARLGSGDRGNQHDAPGPYQIGPCRGSHTTLDGRHVVSGSYDKTLHICFVRGS